jgi:hypothetical protein
LPRNRPALTVWRLPTNILRSNIRFETACLARVSCDLERRDWDYGAESSAAPPDLCPGLFLEDCLNWNLGQAYTSVSEPLNMRNRAPGEVLGEGKPQFSRVGGIRWSRRHQSLASAKWSSFIIIGVCILAWSHFGIGGGTSTAAGPNSGASASLRPTSTPPPQSPGDWVGFSCLHGTVSVAGTQECNSDNGGPYDMCISSNCTSALVGTINGGFSFGKWQATGDASVWCSSCSTTSLSMSGSTHEVQEGEVYECTPNPTISGVGENSYTAGNAQGVDLEAWVNWTDVNAVSSVVQWGLSSGSYTLPDPSPTISLSGGGQSVEFNGFASGTTYYYKVTDTNNCGSVTSHSGSFTTASAPTTGWVGYVFTYSTANSHLVYPAGAALDGSLITFNATCDINYIISPWDFGDVWGVTKGWFDSTGVFPLSWSDGTGYFAVSLSASGLCTFTDSHSGLTQYYQNNFLNVTAQDSGYFNESRKITTTLGAIGDFQEFALQPNIVENVVSALSYIHTTAAECNFVQTYEVDQTVDDYIGGAGTTNDFISESTWTANTPAWGDNNGIQIGWTISGEVNDTTEAMDQAYPVAPSGGVDLAAPGGLSDYLTPPTWTGGDSPGGIWLGVEVPHGITESDADSFVVGQTSSFSSTSGISVDVNVGVSFDFVSFGVGATLTYTSTADYSTQNTMTCLLYNPGTEGQAVFYYTFGDGSTTKSDEAHIWLMGYCGAGGQNTC